jgi:putative phosphoribosyl transferase
MYFKDRREAGLQLANALVNYRYENTAILALSDGGVAVGEQLARSLHSTLSLLLIEPIKLPGLGEEEIGLIDEAGHFTYNSMISPGALEEYMSEMRVVLEEEKMHKMYELTKALGTRDIINPHIFYGYNVIIVSDGLKNGVSFEAAVNFLKPVKTQRIIGAVPVASVPAVDRLHILCDEIHILSVIDNYMDTNHYYEDNTIPDSKEIISSLQGVVSQWQ